MRLLLAVVGAVIALAVGCTPPAPDAERVAAGPSGAPTSSGPTSSAPGSAAGMSTIGPLSSAPGSTAASGSTSAPGSPVPAAGDRIESRELAARCPLPNQWLVESKPPAYQKFDPSSGMGSALICNEIGRFYYPGFGLWDVRHGYRVRVEDLDRLARVLTPGSKSENSTRTDLSTCGEINTSVAGWWFLGVVVRPDVGEPRLVRLPGPCTGGGQNALLETMARAGSEYIAPFSQNENEAEIATGCSPGGWSIDRPVDAPARSKAEWPAAPEVDQAICRYEPYKTFSRLESVGQAPAPVVKKLWDSVRRPAKGTCRVAGRGGISVAQVTPRGYQAGVPITVLVPAEVRGFFEIGGCNRVFNHRDEYIGTADPAAVAAVAVYADSYTAISGKVPVDPSTVH
ncbi:hypothetical protein D1871_18380 [Nakamurella silvestris]|nr:hypothetical protein D1871_18380 [Nakamurella silvestris]